jgi:hypothetical protein
LNIITNEQLNNYLISTLNIVQGKDSILFDIYTNLYLTGLRANELLEFIRWTALLNSTLQCDTEKNSGNRIFTEEELTTNFYTLIINNQEPYIYNSYSTILRYFRMFRTFPDIFHNQKSLNLSLFRHNKCKLLHNAGKTDEEIQQYLCEIDVRNSNNYIYSQLVIL